MNRLSYIFDKFVLFLCGLLLGGYFIPTAASRLTFAFLFSLCVTESTRLLFGRRKAPLDKRYSSVRELLQLSGDGFLLSVLFSPLEKIYGKAINRGRFIELDGSRAIAARFTVAPLSPDALIELNSFVSSFGIDKLTVICDASTPQADLVAKKLGIKLIDYDKLFRLLDKLDCMPEATVQAIPKWDKIRSAFSRKRAFPLLTCAIALFVFSRFVSWSIYYIITAVACLLLSALSLFLPAKD